MGRLHLPALISALVITLFFAPPITTNFQGFSINAYAEELWKQELMDICSKTDEAMSFSVVELKTLLERCEKLRPDIEALEESPRKVYLKRLEKCQNLFTYVLESKAPEK